MSSVSQAHDAHAPDAHASDAHDAHAFTGEPANELPPDETPTAGWLPVLGVVLFTAFGVVLLAERAEGTAQNGAAAGASGGLTAVPVQVAPPPPVTATPRPPPGGPPGMQPGAQPNGAQAPRKIDPATIEALRKAQGAGAH